jgi:hypothetical protein
VGTSGANIPPEFDASPAVQAWIKEASLDKRNELTKLLVVLKDHYLPGGSLLRITHHQDPSVVPSSFNVPFDGCLLNYQVPLRADDPIRLLVILDPFEIPPRDQ